MMDAARKMVNVRWYNPITQQYLWEDPAGQTSWRTVESTEEGDDGEQMLGFSGFMLSDTVGRKLSRLEEHGEHTGRG